VQVWDAKTYRECGAPIDGGDNFWTASLNRRGDRVLTVTRTTELGNLKSGDAKVWDVRTGRLLGAAIRHGDLPISQAAISPDGTLVATCSQKDKDVKIWEVASGRKKASLHSDRCVLSVQFDRSGQTLITAGAMDRIWDIEYRKVRFEFTGTTAAGPPVPAVAATGQRIAVPGDSSFTVYDSATGKKLAANDRHALHIDEFLAGIAISPDAKYIATSSTMGGTVWDAVNGEPLFEVSDAFTGQPVFSPDGRRIIFATPLKPILWSVPDGVELKLNVESYTGAACFSDDGKLLAVGCYNDSTSVMAIDPPNKRSSIRNQEILR
jgi:WD40 repeat protein